MSEQSKPPEGEGFSHEATPPAAGAAGAGSAGKTGSLRRAPVIAGAVALVMTGGIAALAGTGMLGSNAKQPEDVLPGDSIIFAKADLDPGAAQKVSAFRLLDKLPDAKKALSAEDPKKAVFEWAKSKDPDMSGVDYAADIEPWLGDRVGMSVLAPQGSDKEPVVVMALAVKDEAKAKEAISRLQAKAASAIEKAKEHSGAAKGVAALGEGASPGSKATATSKPAKPTAAPSDDKSGKNSKDTKDTKDTVQVYKDGYVLLAAKEDEARLQAEIAKPALSENTTFGSDMDAIGETGVVSGWVDGTRMMELNTDSSTPASMEELGAMAGRSAFALRFAPDYLELAQVNLGMKVSVDAKPLKDVSNLPGDTAAFYSFSGGSDYVKQLWPMLMKAAGPGQDLEAQLKMVEQQTGLALPADLQTLLGQQFDVVVGTQDFRKLAGMPKVGLRMWTDTAKAQSILDKVVGLVNQSTGGSGGFALSTKATGGRLDVALDEGYRAALAAPGNLSSTAGFATVLPGLESSVGALYVNLDAVESQYLDEVPAEHRDLVKSLQSVGMTSQPIKDGKQESTLRLSVN